MLSEDEISELDIKLSQLTEDEIRALPWYRGVRNLWNNGADYILIYGGRSNGKTYDVLKLLLEEYRDHGTRFVYLRRWVDDVNTFACSTLFKDMLIREVFGEGYSINYRNHTFHLTFANSEGQQKKEEIGYAAGISDAKHRKELLFN